MKVYLITTPDRREYTAELNPAGALAELARGNTVRELGLSRITKRVNAMREINALLALEDITEDQYNRATGLMRLWSITGDELNAELVQTV